MNDAEIRFMRLKDIDAVAEIEEATFARPWSRESFRQEVTRNAVARYLVAEEDGQILGYAGAWIIMDESHITNIAVREDARGRGLGKRPGKNHRYGYRGTGKHSPSEKLHERR